jgi:hypothetical protein
MPMAILFQRDKGKGYNLTDNKLHSNFYEQKEAILWGQPLSIFKNTLLVENIADRKLH